MKDRLVKILEQLTVMASIKTINVMSEPNSNKLVKHYMRGAVKGAKASIIALLPEEITGLNAHTGFKEYIDGWNDYRTELLKRLG